MPPLMSFSITTQQMRDEIKDVTRRFGWRNIRPGQIIWAVEKVQGLGKGGKIIYLYPIQIISTRWEPLEAITIGDVSREGFPGWTTEQFIAMLIKSHKGATRQSLINRIEFKRARELELEWATQQLERRHISTLSKPLDSSSLTD